MCLIKLQKIEKGLIAIALIGIFLYISFPLFENFLYVLVGHDTYFHVQRIKILEESLKQGEIRNYIGNFGGKQNITSIMYPNLFLYIPAILNILIKNFNISYNIFKLFIIFLYILSSYFSSKVIFKNKIFSLVFVIIYSANSYNLFNIYIRDAIGESLALAFLPAVISGLFDIYFQEGKHWYLLPIGFSFILESHIITTFYLTILIFFFFIIFIKISLKKSVFPKLVFSGILVLLFNLWFIIPFVDNYCHHYLTTFDGLYYISDFLNLFGNFDNSTVFSSNAFHYGLDSIIILIFIIFTLPYVTIIKKDDFNKKYIGIAIISFIIFLFMFMLSFKGPILDTLLSIEKFKEIYSYQQFSTRISGRATVFMCYTFVLILYILYLSSNNKIVKDIKIIIILLITFIVSINNNVLYKKTDNLNKNYADISNAALSTTYIDYTLLPNDELFYESKNSMIEVDKFDNFRINNSNINLLDVDINGVTNYDIKFKINNFSEQEDYIIDIPIANFLHMAAYVNGMKVPIYIDDNNNIRLVIKIAGGNIKVLYEKPFLYKMANLIFIITLFSAIILWAPRITPLFECRARWNP